MVKVFCGVLAAALLAVGLAFAADAKDGDNKTGEAILGKWQSPDGPHQAFFEVYKTGDKFEGKITGLKEDKYEKGDAEEGAVKHDRENPDKSLKDRAIIGIVFLKGFSYDNDNKYSGGTIYDPESGTTYKCKMTLKGDTLDVRGFVGISMFGRTETWSRTKDSK